MAEELGDAIAKSFMMNRRQILFRSQSGCSLNLTDSLDAQMMGAFFLMEYGDVGHAEFVLDYIESNYTAIDALNNVQAYKAKESDSKVWLEGPYGVAILYYKLDDTVSIPKFSSN